MTNIMVDLETMSTRPNAAIVAIGAVRFDVAGIGDQFYTKIKLSSSVSLGDHVDPDTVVWWLSQSDAARAELVGASALLSEALAQFASWSEFPKDGPCNIQVWGNGANFDNVILAEAYRAAGWEKTPWPFWMDRCYRTVAAMFPNSPRPKSGVAHNALDDAVNQAKHLVSLNDSNNSLGL